MNDVEQVRDEDFFVFLAVNMIVLVTFFTSFVVTSDFPDSFEYKLALIKADLSANVINFERQSLLLFSWSSRVVMRTN